MVSNIAEWLVEKTASFPKWLQTYIVLIACVSSFVLVVPALVVTPIVLIVSGHVVSCVLLTVFVSGPLIMLLLKGEDDGWY